MKWLVHTAAVFYGNGGFGLSRGSSEDCFLLARAAVSHPATEGWVVSLGSLLPSLLSCAPPLSSPQQKWGDSSIA